MLDDDMEYGFKEKSTFKIKDEVLKNKIRNHVEAVTEKENALLEAAYSSWLDKDNQDLRALTVQLNQALANKLIAPN